MDRTPYRPGVSPSTTPDAGSPAVVDAVVVARDAAASIGGVLAALPLRALRTVVVVDNGSTDATSQLARDAGAVVLRQARGGYGAACLCALAHLARLPQPPDVVAFVPGDGSVAPHALPWLVAPVWEQGAELAIGVVGDDAAADRAVARLISGVFRQRVRAVGQRASMRAIRYPALVALGMSERTAAWDVELLVRALKLGLSVVEVAVPAGLGEPAPPGSLAARAGARTRALWHVLRHSTMR
jgi:glycosyltransferase involved in cell wall biosynthesis